MKIKTAAVGEVAGQIPVHRLAHDFQTPLGVIISAGEVLESYFDRLTPERRRVALEDILNSARQMNQSIDSLITFEQVKIRKSAHSRRPIPISS